MRYLTLMLGFGVFFTEISSVGALAQPESKPPIRKYKQLLTDPCWSIPQSDGADTLCLDKNGFFVYGHWSASKSSSGKWRLKGQKLTLKFADGQTKEWNIEFLTPHLIKQDGKVMWKAEWP